MHKSLQEAVLQRKFSVVALQAHPGEVEMI
jgi:hypothetical protein